MREASTEQSLATMMQRVDALAAELKRRDERDRRRRNVGLKSSDSNLTEASMESRPSRHSKAPTASHNRASEHARLSRDASYKLGRGYSTHVLRLTPQLSRGFSGFSGDGATRLSTIDRLSAAAVELSLPSRHTQHPPPPTEAPPHLSSTATTDSRTTAGSGGRTTAGSTLVEPSVDSEVGAAVAPADGAEPLSGIIEAPEGPWSGSLTSGSMPSAGSGELASLPPSLKGSRLVSSLAVLSDVEIKVAEPDMPKGSVENV